GWASMVDPAYDFGVVWHYVTLAEALRELREAGFTSTVEVYDESSFITTVAECSAACGALDSRPDTSGSSRWHLVARKPAPEAPDPPTNVGNHSPAQSPG